MKVRGFNVELSPHIDYQHAQDCRNMVEIRTWCRQFTLISDDEQLGWRDHINKAGNIKMFGVWADKQIGVAGFTSIDRQNRSAEFSLWIDPSQQGKKYGSQALFTLLWHGFKDWGFHRIWGEVFDNNPAMELFRAMGFQYAGKWQEAYFRDGEFIDSHLIDLLARNFEDDPEKWI
jgi:RimJ/RimL family protein N-acetyltransferase